MIKQIKGSKYYNYYFLTNETEKYFVKQLLKEDKIHLKMLENEIEKYNILKKYNIIPKIISYDLKNNKKIIYEYIEGKNLSRIKLYSNKEKLEILIKICDYLEIMHNKRIVHCDINPNNIITLKNEIKIIDLGNSKFLGETTDYGILEYVSLEQLKRNKVSPYFDIYSLGIIIYELFKNENPFKNKSQEEIINLKKRGFIPQLFDMSFPNFNLAINNIIHKSTTLNEKSRYKNINELKLDIKMLTKLLKNLIEE